MMRNAIPMAIFLVLAVRAQLSGPITPDGPGALWATGTGTAMGMNMTMSFRYDGRAPIARATASSALTCWSTIALRSTCRMDASRTCRTIRRTELPHFTYPKPSTGRRINRGGPL